MQYERNDIEFVRGTFRARGEVIDVFPAEHAELAVRITMFDDEIESLDLLDPLTGKIRQKLVRFTVFPSSHYVTPRSAEHTSELQSLMRMPYAVFCLTKNTQPTHNIAPTI